MKKIAWLSIIIPFVLFGFVCTSFSDQSIPKNKQTILKLYITAEQAYEKWQANPEDIKILDVRTPGEYIFVGHAPMAANIPLTFLEDRVNPLTMRPVMPLNENFITDIKKKFNENDTIFIMCRSGSRSTVSVNLMAKAGFKNVYNIVDGFEGDKSNNPKSSQNGKRLANGWKNSGAPWTYKLERGLAH